MMDAKAGVRLPLWVAHVAKLMEGVAPCPFCGSHKVELNDPRPVRGSKAVCCNSCGIHGPFRDTSGVAIRVWNKRKARA